MLLYLIFPIHYILDGILHYCLDAFKHFSSNFVE